MRDTIDMAREAFGEDFQFMPNEPYQRFAELVRADERSVEREACAKICDGMEYQYWRSQADQEFTPSDCATAIRARGNT